MGHEIAHADKRHSTQQLTKVQGASVIGQILAGNNQYAQIATELLIGGGALAYSRAHETEADKFSVIYLCNGGYNANGAAGFFNKVKGKGSSMPEFLSTHPDPGNRVKEIQALATKLRCTNRTAPDAQYARIKSLL
jgi:predicted Zn-dependent protease